MSVLEAGNLFAPLFGRFERETKRNRTKLCAGTPGKRKLPFVGTGLLG